MADTHTVHCRNGGKVVLHGDGRMEVHLKGPLVYYRAQYVRYLGTSEEVRRTMLRGGQESVIAAMLEEAFNAVPQVVHNEEDD